jgi:hypothetical protein
MPYPNNAANVTSPTLGATLTSITVPQSGLYVVAVTWYLSGTVAVAVDADNVALTSDPVTSGTFVIQRVLPGFGIAAPAVPVEPVEYQAVVMAQSTIKLIAIAAGTASSVYHVTIDAVADTGTAPSGL